jgi:hypothetical protein
LSSFVYTIIDNPKSNSEYRENVKQSLNIALNTDLDFRLLTVARTLEPTKGPKKVVNLGGYIIVELNDTLYVSFKGTSNSMETKANVTSVPFLVGKPTGLPRNARHAELLNNAKKNYLKKYKTAEGDDRSIEFSNIHTGLHYTYLRNKDSLIRNLNRLLDSNQYSTVIFTGHSMGAWLAAMTNIDFANYESGRKFTMRNNGYSKSTEDTGAKIERELVWRYKDKTINTISICFSLPPLQNMNPITHAVKSVAGHAFIGLAKRMWPYTRKQPNDNHGGTKSIMDYSKNFKSTARQNFTNYRKTLNRQSGIIGTGKNNNTIHIKTNNLCRFARRSNIRIVQFNFSHDPVSDGKIRSLMGNLAGSANCARTTHDIFTTTVAYTPIITNQKIVLNALENYIGMSRSIATPQVYRHAMVLYLICLVISIHDVGGDFKDQFDIEYFKNIAKMNSNSLVKKALIKDNSDVQIQQAISPLYSRDEFAYEGFKAKTQSNNPHKFLFAKIFNIARRPNTAIGANANRGHLKVLLNKFKKIYNPNRLQYPQQPARRHLFRGLFEEHMNNYVQRRNLQKKDYLPYFIETLQKWATSSGINEKKNVLRKNINRVEKIIAG